MPYRTYTDKNFGAKSMRIIDAANAILGELRSQGYDLTLRQLYYQFVSRDLIPNTEQSYKRLGSIVSDARLAGLIDWSAINDRTRYLRSFGSLESPAAAIDTVAGGYTIDMWESQPEYVEVWVEKDALIGVIERACGTRRVPHFSCRGYTSQSEVWRASQRLGGKILDGKNVTVIHLGDHDPSGIDMTRDIEDRLRLFLLEDIGDDVESMFSVERIALNMDQVRQYGPPPNPAKITDSRASGYIARHGRSSWELDALNPATIGSLIEATVEPLVDLEQWDEDETREGHERAELEAVSGHWSEIREFMVDSDWLPND